MSFVTVSLFKGLDENSMQITCIVHGKLLKMLFFFLIIMIMFSFLASLNSFAPLTTACKSFHSSGLRIKGW